MTPTTKGTGSWSGNRRSFPAHIRTQILNRAGHQCEIQGPDCTGTATEADHRIPHAEGGTDDPANGQAVCRPCHKAKTIQEQTRGRARTGDRRPPEPHPGLINPYRK